MVILILLAAALAAAAQTPRSVSDGVYTQAQRLFGTFLFVPTALGAALLPSLARLAQASQEEFRRGSGGEGSHELRLKSRTIRTDLVPGLGGARGQLKTEAAKRDQSIQ